MRKCARARSPTGTARSTRRCVGVCSARSPFPPENPMTNTIAAIDVHKKVLMVVTGDDAGDSPVYDSHRFLTMRDQLEQLVAWLQARGVEQVVMESTAQYWKPVWQALEPHFRLHLAQAQSNR